MKIQSIKCSIHRDPNTKKQVIPLPAMEVAGLERTEELVFHAQEGCILVGRTDMTAGEAIRVLTYLNQLSDSLVLCTACTFAVSTSCQSCSCKYPCH